MTPSLGFDPILTKADGPALGTAQPTALRSGTLIWVSVLLSIQSGMMPRSGSWLEGYVRVCMVGIILYQKSFFVAPIILLASSQ